MKTFSLLFIVLMMFTACSRQDINEEPTDRWNGYFKYLKMGEQTHTLWAGKNINVGTVTYGIDDNANFYATYDCSASGWTISETHFFAGNKDTLPLNKPGNPKIGRFPFSDNHNPWVSTFTYTIPLTLLPPAEEPGFIVAAHCVVHSPTNGCETAWAEGDFKFTDKGWGWYDVYFFNQPEYPHTIVYGIDFLDGYLYLYHIDMSTTPVTSERIMVEYVGGTGGEFNGAAYDPATSTLIFANVTTNQLWVNQLDDDGASYLAGTLNGVATNATFYDGFYYYVDANTNTIHKVGFTENWTIASEVIISTLPNTTVTVNDISMDPTGTYLYIIADMQTTGTELIKYDVSANLYYSIGLTVNQDAEITFGSDDQLYAIVPEGDGSMAYIIDTNTGVLILIGGGGIDDGGDDVGGGGKNDITGGVIL